MLRSDAAQNHAEPTFTLDRIVNGDFDDDLRVWARAARDFGSPLIAEFGTEVNGEWFPWNGVWNGGSVADGYGEVEMTHVGANVYQAVLGPFDSTGDLSILVMAWDESGNSAQAGPLTVQVVCIG